MKIKTKYIATVKGARIKAITLDDDNQILKTGNPHPYNFNKTETENHMNAVRQLLDELNLFDSEWYGNYSKTKHGEMLFTKEEPYKYTAKVWG
jgi:hypothetical protein